MSEDKITIHFSLTSSPSTPRISTTVKTNTKATELRVVAAEKTEIPLDTLKLIFRGRIIQNDDKIITEYNVENDCVIHCLGKPVKGSAAPTPTTSTGSTASIPVGTPAVSNTGAAASKQTVDSALQLLKSRNSAEKYSTALTTLSKVVSNIITNPNEEKYRKVKQSNAAFGRRLGNVPGGRECMLAVGFVSETPEGLNELHFVLKANADAWNHLVQSKAKVDQVLEQHKRSQSTSTPTFPNPTNPPNFGSFGGAGGLPVMPPMTPAMQQQMSSMMSDPNMMQTMFQNPMFRQAMQNDPRIANNPMLRQALNDPNMIERITQLMSDPMLRNMMSNPAMMDAMRNMSGSMGGMGGGMGASPPQQPNTNMPDPAAFARMMQGFSQSQNSGSTGSQQAPSSSQQGSTNPSSSSTNNERDDSTMTEEEMIAEAIARSLREP